MFVEARVRARLRRGRARDPRAEAEHPASSRTRSAGRSPSTEHDIKRVRGGLLVQDRDTGMEQREQMQRGHRAQARPRRSGASCCSPGGCASTCARTRSCCARTSATVGIGAGQMSRVDSVRIAIEKAAAAGRRSTARRWRPTRSSRSPTARSWRSTPGVTRDHPAGRVAARPEVIEACDAAGVAMVFTSRRHFRH